MENRTTHKLVSSHPARVRALFHMIPFQLKHWSRVLVKAATVYIPHCSGGFRSSQSHPHSVNVLSAKSTRDMDLGVCSDWGPQHRAFVILENRRIQSGRGWGSGSTLCPARAGVDGLVQGHRAAEREVGRSDVTGRGSGGFGDTWV